ncbi:MAG: TldD/PmbA family protein [Deltaproteobacteria bacterium]|nr:TldD/PmbA family protein [Deltaproteobacteria bacterium]
MSALKELVDIATKAMEGATKRGVKGVRAVGYRSRNVSVTFRKGRPDKVQESTRRSLTLHLYIDGKYSACETNDLRPDALERFLDSAVVMTEAMTPDKYRVMPDPALYEGRQDRDLKLFDSSVASVTPDERNDQAKRIEGAALEAAGDIAISAEASFEDEEGEVYQAHSNGFEGSKKGSQFWQFAEISIKDVGDKRPSGWSMGGSRMRASLPAAELVGQETAARAKQRLGSKKIESQKMAMIVENRTVSRLLGKLLAVTSGRALQQKRCFLEGKIGEQVGSKLLTITDDPFIESGFGSKLFDGEGISAKVMPVFDKGVFKSFYIDTYYGKKLDMPPTTGSRSNVIIPPGNKSLDQLVADIDKGILVRGFIGGNSNSTTGDFSLGVYGTLIEKGKLGGAVAEMNISGNHMELWKQLVAVGSDPWPYSSTMVPSLVFDDVQFAGA